MNSQFSAVGSMIERKAMFLFHAVNGRPGHRVNMGYIRKTCDAYVVDRLRAGTPLAGIVKEIESTFAAMSPETKFLKMVYFIEGYDVHTAIKKLDELYNLKEPEARLALMLMQLSSTRTLTAEPNVVEVSLVDDLQPA